MRKVIISCDSTCDLGVETIHYFGINIVPLYITFGNEMLKDGVDIRSDELYERVKNEKKLPKSSAPSPHDYIENFQPIIDKDYDILHISIGSGFSSAYQNAILASQAFPEGRIYVVDGENLSSGSALLALKAWKMKSDGMSVAEIYQAINPLREKVRSQFIIDTLDYLHKGGRCSSMTKIIGSLLKIKPNIKVVSNSMQVARRARGIRQGIMMMLNDVESDYLYLDRDFVIIGHSQAEKEVMRLYEDLLKLGIKRESIIIMEPGCVVSTHCGPGTIGVFYLLK